MSKPAAWFLPVLILCVALTGCGSHGTAAPAAAPSVVSVTVVANSSSLTVGQQVQLTAVATYSDNSTQDVTSSAAWQSADSAVVAVSPSGTLSAIKTGGPVDVSASSGGHSGSLAFTVSAATLSSILVSPNPVSLVAGQTASMKATGVYSDGTSQDITGQVSWSTGDGSIASVSALGLLTAASVGQTTVSATSGAIAGNATVNVSAVVLQSILVTPSGASIAIGQTQAFAAFGIFNDGSTTEFTNSVAWGTDAHAVATIAQDGTATGVGTGTANVTATSGAIIGSVQVKVTPAVLQSINIFPADPSIPVGGQVQFTVTGTFSDNTTQQLSNATYASSDASLATIDPVTGVATGVAANAGPITITATVGAFTDSTTLTVTPATLQSIAVAPASATIAAGTTQAFSVSGIYSDGSIQPLLEGVSWSSSAPAVAAVDSTGLATAITAGDASIEAQFAGFSASADLTVTAPTLVSITVTPPQPTVGIGGSQQFTATGVFSDSSQQDLTSQVQWISSDAAVALIGSNGLASALSTGTTTITSKYGSVTGSATLTVSNVRLRAIQVLPSNPVLPTRTKVQFTAMGVFSDGSTVPLSGVHWSITGGRVARITSQGLVVTKKAGTAKVTAKLNGLTGTTTLTVSSSSVVSLSMVPVDPTIAAGTTQQFKLIANFSNGTQVDVSSSASWKTSNFNEAVIGNTGLASGIAPGQVTITATYKTTSQQTTLTITNATLVGITLNPPAPVVVLGSAVPFTATGSFNDGSAQDITQLCQWSSSDPTVAVVNKAGVASTSAIGVTNISATFKGQKGVALLTVN